MNILVDLKANSLQKGDDDGGPFIKQDLVPQVN